jgi:hypothetical protein
VDDGQRLGDVIVACIPGWIVHSNLKVPAAANVMSTLAGGGVLGFVSRTPVLRKPLPWLRPV